MTNETLYNSELRIWSQLTETFLAFATASRNFMLPSTDRVKLIRHGHKNGDRMTVIHTLDWLQQEELVEIFDLLVFYSMVPFEGAQEAIPSYNQTNQTG